VASKRRFHRATVQVPCLVLAVALAVWATGCRRWCPSSSPGSLLHAPGSFGSRLLVVAPHPDDEILAAGTVIARTIQEGGEVHVVVATAGERGVNRTHAPDLGQARENETRRALGRLAVPASSVEFLDYADETLATAWSDRWFAARHGAGAVTGTAVVEALRTAVRAARPDTVIVPLALDGHPDHVAVARFTLLAVLAATVSPGPRLLGYVVHGDRGWPACRVVGPAVPVVPPGCAGMLPWTGLLLAPSELERKEALIREYATQLGPALLHHARTQETFASDVSVPLGRAAAPWRPSLRRTARGIAITLPRAACGVDPAAGDRLRLRYFRGEALDERVVVLAPTPAVRGGVPGETLHAVADVGVVVKPGSVHVLLDADSFAGVSGAVLEVAGAPTRGPTPAWLLRWS
jgi:LmbE family N-acetylglucosaminyl deacetylase